MRGAVVQWPAALKPDSFFDLPLQGKPIKIGRVTPAFPLWSGELPTDTYGGKPLINLNGNATFAELYLLSLMQSAGWQGVWIDSYRRKFRTGYWGVEPESELPIYPQQTIAKILGHTNFPRTCWDLACWEEAGPIVFIEAKQLGKDVIRESQIGFLGKALISGFKPDQFLIVEWVGKR
jgi:hypothetical protein